MEKGKRMKDIIMGGAAVLLMAWTIWGEKIVGPKKYYDINGVYLGVIGCVILLSEFAIQLFQMYMKKSIGKEIKLKDKVKLSFEYLKECDFGKSNVLLTILVILFGMAYGMGVELSIIELFTSWFNSYFLGEPIIIFSMLVILGSLAVYNIVSITAYISIKKMQEKENAA